MIIAFYLFVRKKFKFIATKILDLNWNFLPYPHANLEYNKSNYFYCLMKTLIQSTKS